MSGDLLQGSSICDNCCNYCFCICCLVEDWDSDKTDWEHGTRNRKCCNYCCCHNKCCCRDDGTEVSGCGSTSKVKRSCSCCSWCLLWTPCCTYCVVLCFEEFNCDSCSRCLCPLLGPPGVVIASCIYGLRSPHTSHKQIVKPEEANSQQENSEEVNSQTISLIPPKYFVA